MFLVKYIDEGDAIILKIATAAEVIKLTNEADIYGISNIEVLDVKDFDNIKRLRYAGWRPECEIIYYNPDGSVAIQGFGEDH